MKFKNLVLPVCRRSTMFSGFLTLAMLSSFVISPLSAQNASESILQRETIRRQELVLRAVKQLDDADRLIQIGKEEEARTMIAEILSQVPEAGEGKPVYVRASLMMSQLEYSLGAKEFDDKKYFEAREHAVSSLKYNKNNTQAQALLLKINKVLGIKEGSDKPENPAVDPKFIGNLNKVDDRIQRARDYSATGQYELAEKELEQVLAIDPYNKVAASDQQKLYKVMRRSKEKATDSSRQERLTQTRDAWSEVYQVESNLEGGRSKALPITQKSNFQVSQKLQSIIIKQVDFTDATIDDAARFLTSKTREEDSTGAGISFIVKNEKARSEARPFSLRLKNVPVGEVLRYICNIAGVKYKVEEFAIFIVPLSDGDDAVLVTREFPVQETFFDTANAGGGAAAEPAGGTGRRRNTTVSTEATTTDPVRRSLEERGVVFAEGSAAIYNRATGILTIKNTQDQIDLVEELVTINQGETLLVRIETKVIQINQNDLDSLAFNYSLAGGYSYPPNVSGTSVAVGALQTGTNLQGTKGLKVSDPIQTFINGVSATQPQALVTTPNRFGVSGTLSENAFQFLMEALSQKTSTDLMTAPSIVVNDGQQANVVVAREFFYPTEFDQATAQSADTSTGNTYTISPSFPTDFESRNVGVSMVVQPRVTVDRQRVFLTLKPEITEFDGFINYGAQIFDPNQPGVVLSPNTVNQPVFSAIAVDNAQLEIQDGYTMVLGGLVREDISTVDDKVPILGDIPLVGRLFRSKAEQAIKKNMMIFVTVRILRPDGEPFNVGTKVVKTAVTTTTTSPR